MRRQRSSDARGLAEAESLCSTSRLTDEECAALVFLSRAIEVRIDQPMMKISLSALGKITASLPDEPRKKALTVMSPDSVSFSDREVGVVRADGAHFLTLLHAIAERRLCLIDYQPAGRDPRLTLQYEPYHLHFWRRSWYALGRSREHDQVRMTKLARMRAIQVQDTRFDRPNSFAPADYLRNAWDIVPGGPETRVRLRFSPKVARNVSEVIWHRTQQHEFLPDGALLVDFVVSGVYEISWWIAGYGDQVIVLEPPELRERIWAMARNVLAQSDDPPCPRPPGPGDPEAEMPPIPQVRVTSQSTPEPADGPAP